MLYGLCGLLGLSERTHALHVEAEPEEAALMVNTVSFGKFSRGPLPKVVA